MSTFMSQNSQKANCAITISTKKKQNQKTKILGIFSKKKSSC